MNQKGIIAVVVVAILVIGGGYWLSQRDGMEPASPQAGGERVMEGADPSMDDTPGDDQEGEAVEHGDVTPSEEGSGAGAGVNVNVDAGVSVDASASVKEFVVNGSNFAFSPSAMTVKKGDRVKITFKNVGGFHDLVIDEFNAKTKQIGNGAEETIEFVADKAGSFEYYCSVGQHRAMGMKGTLTVTE